MPKRSFLVVLVSVALAAAALGGCGSSSSSSSQSTIDAAATTAPAKKTVGVALIAPVALLEDNIAHFKQELAAKGYLAGKTVTYQSFNADGQISNVSSIVTRLVQLHPSVVYLVGTPLVEAFAQQRTSIPVVFGAMTDPVGSKVIHSLTQPGGRVTGTTDAVPPSLTVKLLTETLPGVRRVGVIGDPSEENTVAQIAGIKQVAQARGIEVLDRPVDSTDDVVSAVRSLQGVQALIVPSDNVVFSALGTVVQTADQMRVPTFSTAGGSTAQQGIMVAFGVDYNALGTEAGDLAASILHGGSPATLAVKGLFDGAPEQIGINLAAAKKAGVTIPQSVRQQANLTYRR
jgi:putative tryptophan/tyrosine transport system substrate-binding protein